MKLIYCMGCQSSVRLVPKKVRECECGNVKGLYGDGLEAFFVAKTDHYFLIGYDSYELQRAVNKDQKDRGEAGRGLEFKAFIIQEPCETFTRMADNKFNTRKELVE